MEPFQCRKIPTLDELKEIQDVYPNMNPESLYVFLNFIYFKNEVERTLSPIFVENKLSKGRFVLMMQLLDKKTGNTIEMSPAEIADGASVTRATITGLVDGLVKDGLVERDTDPNDRRRIVVRLSEKGLKLMHKLIPVHFENISNILVDLSSEEKGQLIQLFQKICNRIETIDPHNSSPNFFCSL